jgi:teichuronic acid exporter
MSNIKKKFISGVIWESLGRFSALGIQLVVTILIARVLSPSDFGIIGLLTIFIALGQILVDSGFSQALIQKKDADEIDFSTVFFLNFVVAVILYFLLFNISPYIATFYKLSDLTDYARILFLIIPINSLGLIQNVLIQKELNFKKSAFANLFSAIFSGVVGIGMAYSGFGIWALVGQQISLNVSKTLLYILQRRWFPIFTVSITAIKEMFAFSINLMLHSIVNVTMKNIYALVIGKYFPVSEVGYYTQADKFQEVSASTITQIVIKVSFPTLIQKKDDIMFVRVAYLKIIKTTIFLIAPLMIFLVIIGEPLFKLLLTEKWLPAVPYFRILCIYGMFLPLLQISYNLYKVFRKGRLLFRIDSLRHFTVIISLLSTIKYGILYMLYAFIICNVIIAFFNLYKSGVLISLTLHDQLKSILPYYFISSLVGIIVYMLPDIDSYLVDIVISGGVFLFLYLKISKFFRLDGYIECVSIFKSFIYKYNLK